jgi:hypothetical protein
MPSYRLYRTGQSPLVFQGEDIACVYGRWAHGVSWGRYHNLAVYRATGGRYVLSIQYRTDWTNEQPYDCAVIVGKDVDGLAQALTDYDPTMGLQRNAETHGPLMESVHRRYQQQVSELLNHVRSVEEGHASPPLRSAVVVEWGELDDDVIERLESIAVAEGVTPQEVLRRAIEQEMEAEGEGNAIALSVDNCFDCHARKPDVVFTSKALGYSLCQSCFEARAAKKSET